MNSSDITVLCTSCTPRPLRDFGPRTTGENDRHGPKEPGSAPSDSALGAGETEKQSSTHVYRRYAFFAIFPLARFLELLEGLASNRSAATVHRSRSPSGTSCEGAIDSSSGDQVQVEDIFMLWSGTCGDRECGS